MKVKDVNELKSLGKFAEVKREIKKDVGDNIKITGRGWNDLYKNITKFSNLVQHIYNTDIEVPKKQVASSDNYEYFTSKSNEYIFYLTELDGEIRMKNFYKVIFTNGVQIRMKTGDQAVCYISGEFIDWDTSYQDFKKRYLYNNETEEQFEKLRKEVDWEATKSFMSTEKDFQNKIEALSHYSPFYNIEVK